MKRGNFKHIEELLRDYPRLDKYLKDREEELLYPTKEPDKNIGGSRSTVISKTTERKAILIAEDMRLRELRKQKEAIDYAFECSDYLTKRVIECYYMSKTKKTWDTVTLEVASGQISVRTLKRLRTSFFEKIESALGW